MEYDPRRALIIEKVVIASAILSTDLLSTSCFPLGAIIMDRFLAHCMSFLFLCWVALALVVMSFFWRFDHIEQYFGVSPDNGDGSIEVLCVLVVCILIVALALRIRTAKTRHGK